MGLIRKNPTEPSEKKGLKVQVNHKLIDKEQAEIFTSIVKETVKVLVIGALITTAAAFTMKFGTEYISRQLDLP